MADEETRTVRLPSPAQLDEVRKVTSDPGVHLLAAYLLGEEVPNDPAGTAGPTDKEV